MNALIVFAPEDNVAVALADLPLGGTVPVIDTDGRTLATLSISGKQPDWFTPANAASPAIPRHHKVAVRAIAQNEPITRDRVPIGLAAAAIPAGQLVHQVFRDTGGSFARVGGNISEYPNRFAPPQHQLDTLAAAAAITTAGLNHDPVLRPAEPAAPGETVMAYARPDGVFGARNHLLVLPAVFCVNQEAAEIAAAFADEAWGDFGENRVIALPHVTGCCQTGVDEAASLRVLTNMAAHPNVGAVLIVMLGCSPFCVQERLAAAVRRSTATPVRCVEIQRQGRAAALAAGTAAVRELLATLRTAVRTPQPLARLLLAVKCGASDPTSGLFANTALGLVADRILDSGGSVVISEIMEYFGAENMLKARCRDQAVWLDLLRLIKTNELIGKAAAVAAEQDIHSMELTMGNIAAGLSTQEEKSLGAVRKMGFAHPIENVVAHGRRLAGQRSGLYVMDGPGQDLLSVSGLSAAGAQVMLFSTGIGNPLGAAVTPVLKVTGNPVTAERQADFIDRYVPFVETLRAGGSARTQAGDLLLNDLRAVLAGRPTLAELNRHRDFAVRTQALVQ
ncbi:MAG TPA: UxaA family hydrolase [bacterium]|nr:UxaA family hydrolase [bacterium]